MVVVVADGTASPVEALARAVELLGSQAALGRVVGVSQPAVWRWLDKKQSLPAEYVLAVEAATGVSKHDLRPDIYPRDPAPAPDGRFEHVR